MPEEAPVMTMVLPSRRLDMAEVAMLRMGLWRGLRGAQRLLGVRRKWALVRRGRIRGFY
jgi:hypothetical protein